MVTKSIRLDIDSTGYSRLYEIDAICLYGYPIVSNGTSVGLSTYTKNLLKNPLFSDITFEVEGKEIKGHKCIIVSRSDVFEKMFTLGTKEKDSVKAHNLQ